MQEIYKDLEEIFSKPVEQCGSTRLKLMQQEKEMKYLKKLYELVEKEINKRYEFVKIYEPIKPVNQDYNKDKRGIYISELKSAKRKLIKVENKVENKIENKVENKIENKVVSKHSNNNDLIISALLLVFYCLFLIYFQLFPVNKHYVTQELICLCKIIYFNFQYFIFNLMTVFFI